MTFFYRCKQFKYKTSQVNVVIVSDSTYHPKARLNQLVSLDAQQNTEYYWMRTSSQARHYCYSNHTQVDRLPKTELSHTFIYPQVYNCSVFPQLKPTGGYFSSLPEFREKHFKNVFERTPNHSYRILCKSSVRVVIRNS